MLDHSPARPGRLLLALLLPALVMALGPRARGQEIPGPKPDGSTLLPNGWSLRPHGRQIDLPSDLPIRMVWHPAGRVLAVQHAGYRGHEVVLFDAKRERLLARLPLGKTWSGMAFSPDGGRLYVSGGVDDAVKVFAIDVRHRHFEQTGSFAVGETGVLDLPAGLVVDGGGRLFVPLQRSGRIVRLAADGEPQLAIPIGEGSYPFECLVHDGKLYVSLWGKGCVRVFDAETGADAGTVRTGSHPSELCLDAAGGRLFVSNGNENTVSVIDLERQRVAETLTSALYPTAPPGSTPNALALSPNGHVLLVANADNNDLAVLDVSEPGRSRGLGFVPVGAYPTSVRWHRSGKVIVCNGKGSAGSRRNPGGPTPVPGRPRNLDEYTGSMFRGSLSVFAFPEPPQLQQLTEAAYRCSPLRAANAVRGSGARPTGSPIPPRLGQSSPIRHCVYLIKENRTYDQVLGDEPRGNGDPELCLFPEAVSPNHHALAREFGLLDNFYVESEVSADGHEWTMGAYATDFVERSWPVVYGNKGEGEPEAGKNSELGYPAEANFEIAFPENRYLWDRAAAAGISYYSFGEFVRNGATPAEPGEARYPALEGHFDPMFRSFDLAYPDVKRAERFIAELGRFEKLGELPRLVVLRLPNDHTAGTARGRPTPRAYVADNDLALGMVVEALSHSSFWKSMAIFVVEDDAQNGPDHVDAHRSVGYVLSPYARRGVVVSTMYSTCSMLRTMELILGLPPMSQFDAAARPMYDVFQGRADLTPYVCRQASWPLDEKNKKTAYGAVRSMQMNLAREDAADDLELNEIVWKSIRGADSEMPTPRRAAFVRVVDRE